jgi:DNA-directed RNA polymerase subunit RPC12/RpoP
LSSLSKVLSNPRYQALLKALKDGKLEVIEPVISFERGIEYPKLKEFFNSEDEAKEALDALVEAGILVLDVADNVMACPHCRSHKLMARAVCPACGSPKLSRSAMVEHTCGHMDFEEKFKGELGAACPRCGKLLDGCDIRAEFKVISTLYRCLSCKRVFSEPKMEYLCSNGHRAGEGSLAFEGARAYRLSPEKRVLLEHAMLDLEELFKPLREEGLTVEGNAVIAGRSGVAHDFSFAVWDDGDKGKPPLAVGLVQTSERVTAPDVLALHVKAFDVGAERKLILARGGVDREVRDLAKTYGIEIVESRDPKELIAEAGRRVLEVARSGRQARSENKTKISENIKS